MENLLQNQTPISPLTTIDARQDFSSNKTKIVIGALFILAIAGLILFFSKSREGPKALTDKERAELIEKIKKEGQPILSEAQRVELVNNIKTQGQNATALTDESRSNLIDQIKNIK